MGELSAVEDDLRIFDTFAEQLEELTVLNDLAVEEGDEETSAEVEAGLVDLRRDLSELEIRVLLSGEHDTRDAVVTVHAGGRGTDSA
jgi:peptide chain release factor 2